MNTPDDARLKRDFESLREDDLRAASDFLDTLSASRSRAVAVGRRRSRNQIFIAGTLLFATVALMMVVRTLQRPIAQPASLSNWSSPTAFLLETPGKQLWSEIPRLG